MPDGSSPISDSALSRPAGALPAAAVADSSASIPEPRRPELASALHSLVSANPGSPEAKASLRRVAEELQTNRAELELRNRVLHDTQGALEQALHRYADLYDSLPIGYVTLSTAGAIVESNRTASDMLRVAPQELPDKYLHEFLSGQDAAALAGHLAACLATEGRHTLEVTLEPRGGLPFFAQISSQRTLLEGRTIFRTALTDISNLKETQHSLEAIVTEQEDFAYSISHDLRSPLLTISNFAALLTDDTVALAAEERREIIDRIQRAATRMDQLLLTLLDYTRVSRHPMPFEPVSVEEIVHDLLQEHEAAIRERRAQLAVQSPLPRVLGSRTLLNHALDNLLSNALKFTPPGCAPVVRIAAERRGRMALLTVSDEGIGIPVRHHERIFRIFERLHTQAAYPGTGIGLALVRRAAERMHGRVWVESEEGRGSRFFLELPSAEAGDAPGPG